jgi:hypothetical protein
MKRIGILAISIMMVVALVAGISTAMAAKPQDAGNKGMDVIAKSNGFPSGLHFNLNVHGKSDDYQCDPAAGGNSVFIREYGESTLQYVSNKKASLTELTVLDKCAEFFDGDPAVIQLPYKIQLDDGSVVNADGYYVFGRILAKPNNGKSGNESSIILYPNSVVDACNDPGNPDFGNLTECPDDPLLALGLIVGDNLYKAQRETYVRFDPGNTGGKGKSRATDITGLFTYTGWVLDAATFDLDGDGDVDCDDVILSGVDWDGDLDVDCDDLDDWIAYWQNQELPEDQKAWYFENEWVFNIADLVITEQGLVNDGTKLLQIRFYPRATTEFNPN